MIHVHHETGPSHVTGLGAGSNLISSTKQYAQFSPRSKLRMSGCRVS